MRTHTVSKEFKFIDSTYKVTKYIGANVIEISELSANGIWGRLNDGAYKRIYFGHIDPLKEAVAFFESLPANVESEPHSTT